VLGSDPFLGLRAFCGLASLFPPMKTVTEKPPLPRVLSAQDGTPTSLPNPAPLFSSFPLRFLSTFFHPSSVSPWRGAGPAAVANVDGGGCAGSVSTSACSECMRVGVGEVSLSCFAGFEAPSISTLAAEVVSMEEAAAAVWLALAFASGVPGSPL